MATSKAKQFYETSSSFECGNVKNEAILPDSIFEADNSKNGAILRDILQKWKVECRADGLVPVRFANATPLRKSTPWPPNIFDEHVSCTAPATRNASLQIRCKCPRLAIVFGNATNPHVLLTLPSESLATARQNHILEMCFAPQRRALFRQVVRTWCVLYILTWKCASRHNRPKVVREWCVLYILTWKCASRHTACIFSFFISPDGSASAALASLLFEPPKPQISGKTQCFATLLPFRAPASSVFWLDSFSSLIFFLLFSSAFSSVHIVGSLTSKLPSIITHNVPLKPRCFSQIYGTSYGSSLNLPPEISLVGLGWSSNLHGAVDRIEQNRCEALPVRVPGFWEVPQMTLFYCNFNAFEVCSIFSAWRTHTHRHIALVQNQVVPLARVAVA